MNDETPMVKSMQERVEEFMNAAGQIVRKTPTVIPESERILRTALIDEEIFGFNELFESMRREDLVGIADGLADALYVLIGTASAYGFVMEDLFSEAHRSNMTKFGFDDASQSYFAILDENGKVMKPATYSPADFEQFVPTTPETEI